MRAFPAIVTHMWEAVREDIAAVLRNDPAAKSWLEVVICHTPLHAIVIYRLAHYLHTRLHVSLLARLLSALARFWTGAEIHPGARIGRRFFIDHGTGLVIGETAEVGDDCIMFHAVTLGGTGRHSGKRHPTVGDGVLIGTSATLLGPVTVGAHSKIGANSVIIMRDVPENCTVVGAPARIVKLNGKRVDLPLERTKEPAPSD